MSGKVNLFAAFIYVVFAVVIYFVVQFTPVYFERYYVIQIMQAGVNELANKPTSKESVIARIEKKFSEKEIEHADANNIKLVKDGNTVEGFLEYTVIVEHPRDIIKPSVFNFEISVTGKKAAFSLD